MTKRAGEHVQDDGGYRELVSDGSPAEFVSVPIRYIPRLAQIYVGKLETEPTVENCLCMWMIHPDDIDKSFEEARKRRSNEHPMCPCHTKEGLIGGFLKFLLDNDNICLACLWGCNSCAGEDSCECYEHQDLHPDNTEEVSLDDVLSRPMSTELQRKVLKEPEPEEEPSEKLISKWVAYPLAVIGCVVFLVAMYFILTRGVVV